MGELDGKVAIVTGAGRLRGIGRSTALALAGLGCDVVITGTGRDPSTFPEDEKRAGWRDIDGVAEQIRESNRRALPLVVDVTESVQVRRMVDRTLEEFGRIDILVNNAAYPSGPDRVPVTEMDEAIFRGVLEVKVTGTFLCSHAVARAMTAQGQGGKIVIISSIVGKSGPPDTSAYAAACAATHGFTQSLARELAPYRINVNAVCPGLVDTARNDPYGKGEAWEQIVCQIPMQRAGTPEEIGSCIAFLCTEAAAFIHGQCINIDGGSRMEH